MSIKQINHFLKLDEGASLCSDFISLNNSILGPHVDKTLEMFSVQLGIPIHLSSVVA